MNLLDSLYAAAQKYVLPYAASFLGLNLANASGVVNAGVGTAAVAALFPAALHLGVDVVNDVKGIVADVKAVEAAAAAAPAASASVAVAAQDSVTAN